MEKHPVKATMSRRLAGNFLLVLVIFIVFLFSSFYLINQRSVLHSYEDNMAAQVVAMAHTLGALENQAGGNPQGQGQGKNQGAVSGRRGYQNLLRHLDDLSPYDVWVVDRDANQVTMGKSGQEIPYDTLPEEARDILGEVFAGNVVQSRSFSALLGEGAITAGAPVWDTEGAVMYGVLMHGHVAALKDTNSQMLRLLVTSSVVAVLAALLLALWLSRRFVAPLRRMQVATERIAAGEVGVRTEVQQGDEIGQLARDIDSLSVKLAQAEAERNLAEENRRSFLSSLSHELKTPVTVLRASLEAVEEEMVQDPTALRQYSSLLSSEVQQLDRFIGDLLEITNLQNPGFVIQRERLALYDVVMDAVRSQRQIARQGNISLEINCVPCQVTMEGDYGRLRQLFGAILSNAIKYSEAGGVVEVHCRWATPIFEVRIVDYGQGMRQEEKEQIFTRFYRGKDTDKPGSGLGLSIAWEIAERHNATLVVESAPGEGSTFIVRLPAEMYTSEPEE